MNDLPLPDEQLSIEEKVDRCQAIIGYQFQDRTLLLSALTHASVASTLRTF